LLEVDTYPAVSATAPPLGSIYALFAHYTHLTGSCKFIFVLLWIECFFPLHDAN
jgi:hypothetical protein